MTVNSVNLKEFKEIDAECLNKILIAIPKVRIALIGDLCLDMYWKADMTKSDISRETPHYPLPIVEEWLSPGAGGNAAANIASLNPENLYLISVIGKDWRGDLLGKEFSRYSNIDTSGILSSSSRVTNAYCKPLRKGVSDLVYEDPRIDFSNHTSLSKEDEISLINILGEVADKVDIICVTDQFNYGCITSSVRKKIIELGKRGHKIIVDSRCKIGLFTDVILKPNELEGWRAINGDVSPISMDIKEQVIAAHILAENNNAKVCMTLGKKGCVYADRKNMVHINSYIVEEPVDICGAGDTFLSAFACAIAAGAEAHEAALFANMAADVTIKKIGTTGTASTLEIKKRHNEIFGG